MEETLKLILEKITQVNSKITQIDSRITSLEKGQNELKENQNKLSQGFVNCENKVDDKLAALFDGYKQNTDSISELKESVNKLISNQERQDVEIKVIHTKVQ